ncbi:Proteasome activator complex subunit 4, partial [Balamuthia mandrillaris]
MEEEGTTEEGRALCDQLFTGGVDDGEREYDYLRWLPEIYRDEIPREGQRLLQEIKEGLVTCLATHEKSLFTHYAKELNYYLDLKYELSVEDRLVLIRLLLQLVLIPEQAMSLVTVWADILDRLLSKRRLRLEERLKVPWRPFYELLRPHFVHQKTVQKPDITRINHARFLLALIKTLKRFWKEEATEEIMAEFRPYFCALDSQFGDAIGFITLFLPTNADTSICKSWLEECFALWEWFDHSPNLTYMWLDLFANLAEDQAGLIDLSPYYSRFLTIFLTLIDIPVGSTAFPAPKAVSFGNDVFFGWESDHSKKKYGLGSVSGIIVYCLSPTSPMQESLDKLLHILEPYYHPSNDGPWVRNLALFLSSLCFHFARRVGQELDERTCRTPIAHRLGLEERQRFVRCLQPIVMKALLSKREVMAAQAQRALKSLANVCPEIVVPEVIESTFHDLTTLTETHRTQSALETLSMLARPLLWRRHYPAGASHLQTLLFLTLPGIDANDPHKTAATLNFYLDLLGNVPLIDSTALVDDKSVNEWDKAVIQATGFFANWTLEFLDRVFTILTLQGDSFDKGSSKTLDIEGSISLIIVITTQFLFQQASDEIHELALDHIYRFVFSSMPMHSLKYVADMVTAATTGKAKKALSMFIPRLHTLLVYDQDDSSKWLSVSELRWYLRITAAVVRVAAEELLPFRNQLIDILTNTLQHNDKQVFKSAGKLLRYTLQVLTTVYQVEKRSVPPALWSSSYFAQNHWKYWGEPNELDKLDMQWNIPSGASLSFGNELVNLFCYPALTRLQEIISPSTDSSSSPPQKKHKNVTNSTQQSSPSTASSTTSSKGSFLRDLYLVMNVVRSYVHPEYGQTVHSTSASGIEMRRHSPYIGEDVLWARLEEDPSYHRSKVTLPQIRDLLHKLLVHLMECREDEITAICTAVKIVKKLFKNGPKSNKVLAGYQFYRDRIRDRVRGRKQHPRWIHVSRVNILHLQRMGMQRFDMKPYLSILDDLFHLSLHSYRQVRRKTQPIYLQLLRRSDANVKKEHAIRCLKVLDSAESTTAQAKGACHLARRFLNRMTGSWILVKQFCFSFCRTFHHDEPKLQALLTELIALFEVNLSGPTIRLLPLPSLQPDPSLIELAQKVGCELPSLECIQHCREVQSQKVHKNITLWNETINTLLEFTATPSLHWKYEISAAVLLALFIRDDAKPTAANYSSMMEFFAKRAISEIQGLRITSLKAMASLLWIYKRQRRRVYHNDSFQKQSHQRLLHTIQHMDQPLSLEEWHHSFFLDKNYLGWMGIVAPKKNFSYREGFLRPSITTTTTSLSLSTTTFTQDHQTKVIIDSEPEKEKEKEERDEEEGSKISSKDMEWNESFMLEKEEADTLNAYFASVDYWQTFMSRYKDQQRHENKIGFSRDSASLFKRLFQRYWDRFF